MRKGNTHERTLELRYEGHNRKAGSAARSRALRHRLVRRSLRRLWRLLRREVA